MSDGEGRPPRQRTYARRDPSELELLDECERTKQPGSLLRETRYAAHMARRRLCYEADRRGYGLRTKVEPAENGQWKATVQIIEGEQ